MDVDTQIETLASLCRAQRGPTKDNGDGTVTVTFKLIATHLPIPLRDSPEGSSWIIECKSEHSAYSFVATRSRLADCTDGKVEMRFIVTPAALPDHALYGNKGMWVDMTLRISANKNPYPYHIDKTERAAVLTRLVMNCADPAFHAFLERECNRQGVPIVPSLADSLEEVKITDELRAIEHVYRLLGINSRREILESNKTAERAEALTRQFRDHLKAKR